MGKAVTADDLSKQIKALERELFNARVHFDIYIGVGREWDKHIRDVRNSPVFWHFTMKAHIDTTVLGL
jgi:hypothetical protein